MSQRDNKVAWVLWVKSGLHKPHLGSPPSKLTQRCVPFLLGSIQQLHDRVMQLCAEYRDLYEKLNIPDVGPRVDWAGILDQKMVTAAVFRCISQLLQGQIMSAIVGLCQPSCAQHRAGTLRVVEVTLGRRTTLLPPLKTLWRILLIDPFRLRATGGGSGRDALLWDERMEKVMFSRPFQPYILGFHAARSWVCGVPGLESIWIPLKVG